MSDDDDVIPLFDEKSSERRAALAAERRASLAAAHMATTGMSLLGQ
jgi:hypothetical protein